MFRIQFKLLMGLVKFNYEIPYMDLLLKYGKNSNKAEVSKSKITDIFNIQDSEGILGKIVRYDTAIIETSKYILKKAHITTFRWWYNIGLGEAALTGFSCGVAWTLVSILLIPFIRNNNIDEISININPIFNESILEIDIFCIIKFKIAHIIIAGFKCLKECIKGGVFNDRTSNSRINENNYGKH